MNNYSEYRDSGIEWIGTIPRHWDIIPLKFSCSLKGRIGWNGLKSDEFKTNSYAYLVTGQDFLGQNIQWDKCYQIDKERYDEDPFIQLKNGDLLITKDGTIGKIAIVSNLDKPACLNSGIFVLKQTKHNYFPKFLYWLLSSKLLKDFNNVSSSGTTIQHLYQNVFENMPLLTPSLHEQELIANYLDQKVSAIQDVISRKKDLLSQLSDYRTAILSEYVSHGVNPFVVLNKTGNQFIPTIPENWTIQKVLRCLEMSITDGPHTTPELFDDGIPFVSAEAVSCGNGRIDFNHIRGYISKEFYNECCLKYIPQKDDIYMIKSGATTGRVAIVDTDRIFTIWSPLAVFRCDKSKMLPKYLFYTLQAPLFQQQVELGWSFGTQQNIGMRTLEQLFIPVPPINEQRQIIACIEDKIGKIDECINETMSQVDDLEKYLQAIIYEAVTGKIQIEA